MQLAEGNRWGDYGALTVDPADDCTFWYAGQYFPETSLYSWATQVVSFRLRVPAVEFASLSETGSEPRRERPRPRPRPADPARDTFAAI